MLLEARAVRPGKKLSLQLPAELAIKPLSLPARTLRWIEPAEASEPVSVAVAFDALSLR